jgi:hypothetical protein
MDDLYDRYRIPGKYNCWHHASEVWERLTGVKLKIGAVLSVSAARSLRRIPKPVAPCIVLMEHPLLEKHVGVFVGDGIIHLAARGVQLEPFEIVTRSFTKVRCYQ